MFGRSFSCLLFDFHLRFWPMTKVILGMITYWAFVKLFLPILTCFLRQPQSLMPFATLLQKMLCPLLGSFATTIPPVFFVCIWSASTNSFAPVWLHIWCKLIMCPLSICHVNISPDPLHIVVSTIRKGPRIFFIFWSLAWTFFDSLDMTAIAYKTKRPSNSFVSHIPL